LGDPTPNPNFWGIFFGILGFSNFDPLILELAEYDFILTLHVVRTSRVLLKTRKKIRGQRAFFEVWGPRSVTPLINLGFLAHNFVAFELWPTKFCRLVALPEGFPKTSKYLDQSSPISRKSKSSSKFDPL